MKNRELNMSVTAETIKPTSAICIAKQVIATEIRELDRMAKCLDEQFQCAVDLILNSDGRVIVVGMGKSGIIGKKISATLSSTGTPSFFVHPAEAFHGDLGMIHPSDILLLISNSGETEELIRLLPYLKNNIIIGFTGNKNSTLGRVGNVIIDISVEEEACHNKLAPTSSTTNTLVLGDALAVTLSSLRNFQPQDFARFHPGGNLGRRLLTQVSDVMVDKNLPFCTLEAPLKDIVHVISSGRLGLALILNENDELAGVISDGDVRRVLDSKGNPLAVQAQEIMSTNPRTITAGRLVADAENRMRDLKINALVVVDENERKKVLGIVQIWS